MIRFGTFDGMHSLPTFEVGDTVFVLFGDGFVNADSIVNCQVLDDGRYSVKQDTNETVVFLAPNFGPEDEDAEPDEAA